MDIIAELNAEQIKRLNPTIPEFAPGDTIIVNVKVKEGERFATLVVSCGAAITRGAARCPSRRVEARGGKRAICSSYNVAR